ncbi:MAG: hypothetical protein ACK5VI_02820 [Opitutia bacterium]|jgi:hypothetical protein
MTEKREPYEPYACLDSGMAQLRALEMFRQHEDYTRNRQEALIRALWRVVGVQAVIIFLLLVFG